MKGGKKKVELDERIVKLVKLETPRQEIASTVGITVAALYQRISRLKKAGVLQ